MCVGECVCMCVYTQGLMKLEKLSKREYCPTYDGARQRDTRINLKDVPMTKPGII